MGLWTGIKTIFSSSPDKALDAAKGVGNFIDESFFTDQEKSEAHMKLLDWKLRWLHATQGMNLARRVLSYMFCGTFIGTFILCIISLLMGHFLGQDVMPLIDKIIELAEAFKLGYITITIVVFYYGKGILEGNGSGKKPSKN